MKKFIQILGVIVVSANVLYADFFSDVAFVIDQSISMIGGFNWLGSSINSINTTFNAEGINAKWGVAGYERQAGFEYPLNAWVDLTTNTASIVDEVTSIYTYGGIEDQYHAINWSTENFSWTGNDYSKVMIAITDEIGNFHNNYTYDGLFGESAIAQKVTDENILLNVITPTPYYYIWDDVVFAQEDDPDTEEDETYVGLYDLEVLRTDPVGFTSSFVSAKVNEIKKINPDPGTPVPEPCMLSLLGIGLIAVAILKKRSSHVHKS